MAQLTFPADVMGNPQFWVNQLDKTSNYTILPKDNGALITNSGASGAVVFTLPSLKKGYFFWFKVVADQNVTISSAEGDNVVAFNDASADSVAFSTSGQKIGGGMFVASNSDGTKWLTFDQSSGANTVTVAT